MERNTGEAVLHEAPHLLRFATGDVLPQFIDVVTIAECLCDDPSGLPGSLPRYALTEHAYDALIGMGMRHHRERFCASHPRKAVLGVKPEGVGTAA